MSAETSYHDPSQRTQLFVRVDLPTPFVMASLIYFVSCTQWPSLCSKFLDQVQETSYGLSLNTIIIGSLHNVLLNKVHYQKSSILITRIRRGRNEWLIVHIFLPKKNFKLEMCDSIKLPNDPRTTCHVPCLQKRMGFKMFDVAWKFVKSCGHSKRKLNGSKRNWHSASYSYKEI